jgi:hypothetical protein
VPPEPDKNGPWLVFIRERLIAAARSLRGIIFCTPKRYNEKAADDESKLIPENPEIVFIDGPHSCLNIFGQLQISGQSPEGRRKSGEPEIFRKGRA